jgi:hypothetical protein
MLVRKGLGVVTRRKDWWKAHTSSKPALDVFKPAVPISSK